jgi:hypothetical protein
MASGKPRIGVDTDSNFLDWKAEHGEVGTNTLVARTRKACQRLDISLKVLNEEMVLKGSESEYKTKRVVRVIRFLKKQILRPDKLNGLLQHKCHGASFVTLGNSEVSNSLLTKIHLPQIDGFISLMIVGREDCLPTLVNVQRWNKEQEGETCRRCREEKKATLAHILNECKPNLQLRAPSMRGDQLYGVPTFDKTLARN